MEEFQPFFGYYFFNGLLLVLQGLHIFWAWLILRMVYKFLCHGQVSMFTHPLLQTQGGAQGFP